MIIVLPDADLVAVVTGKGNYPFLPLIDRLAAASASATRASGRRRGQRSSRRARRRGGDREGDAGRARPPRSRRRSPARTWRFDAQCTRLALAAARPHRRRAALSRRLEGARGGASTRRIEGPIRPRRRLARTTDVGAGDALAVKGRWLERRHLRDRLALGRTKASSRAAGCTFRDREVDATCSPSTLAWFSACTDSAPTEIDAGRDNRGDADRDDDARRCSPGSPNHAVLRAELRRLFRWLKDRGVTAVITGERGEELAHALRAGRVRGRLRHPARPPRQRPGVDAAPACRQVPRLGARHQRVSVPDRRATGIVGAADHVAAACDHAAPTERVSTGIPGWTRCSAARASTAAAACWSRARAGTGKSSIAAQLRRRRLRARRARAALRVRGIGEPAACAT